MLREVAHILMLNIENLKNRALSGKMFVVFYLFKYGRDHGLQYYLDFSFEILKDILTTELSDNTQEKKVYVTEIGLALLSFVENEFISDHGVGDILNKIDDLVEYQIQLKLKSDDILIDQRDLQWLYFYLLKRINFRNEQDSRLLKMKNILEQSSGGFNKRSMFPDTTVKEFDPYDSSSIGYREYLMRYLHRLMWSMPLDEDIKMRQRVYYEQIFNRDFLSLPHCSRSNFSNMELNNKIEKLIGKFSGLNERELENSFFNLILLAYLKFDKRSASDLEIITLGIYSQLYSSPMTDYL